jgi:hypothetical protein
LADDGHRNVFDAEGLKLGERAGVVLDVARLE